MKFTLVVVVAALAAGTMSERAGAGAIQFDQNVTNNVIYGSGNTNGDFTTDRESGTDSASRSYTIELGLRAKIPYVGSINPVDNTYQVASGMTWNFDWSINSDYINPATLNLNAFRFEIGVDSNPDVVTSVGDFAFVDPFALGLYTWDNSFGNNGTAQGAGVETSQWAFLFPNLFTSLVNNNNLAQNSWQPVWANTNFNNSIVDGTYDIILNAFDKGNNALLASTNIQVIVGAGGVSPSAPVVPVPAAAGLGFLGMGLVGFLRRRKTA